MRVAVVTGASRGIGAETAVALAATGDAVVVNYREKARRAEAVCARIRDAGGTAIAARADLTDDPAGLLDVAIAEFGRLDVLVLNASGGLELGAPQDYPMRINRDAQVTLARAAAERMTGCGRIVFVTSHQAHFSESRAVPSGYEPIAASKLAGERALRELIPEFEARGTRLTVVSGDMIDGTIIVKLLERRDVAAVDARRRHGPLPTVEEFAAAVADATRAEEPSGHTAYIGGSDYTGAENSG
ncbi:SDR family oxidoreductase [Tsukamurella sp. 8F]|uniref:SDR family oxidoreductase n=1 Tax=unclassified Tsukamurella TaxID=2633480 RepID=UPI0023BA0ECD|nr:MULTISPECIES: SDR family oxidoreductase [unclassified Tsukamurella]MDF0530942.1 SDR family oxidoreductase [Tsukamurella sp. 8J]MDF0588267.1 SDR family oxidoreductase [Tsukamurella sp. 8F]